MRIKIQGIGFARAGILLLVVVALLCLCSQNPVGENRDSFGILNPVTVSLMFTALAGADDIQISCEGHLLCLVNSWPDTVIVSGIQWPCFRFTAPDGMRIMAKSYSKGVKETIAVDGLQWRAFQ